MGWGRCWVCRWVRHDTSCRRLVLACGCLYGLNTNIYIYFICMLFVIIVNYYGFVCMLGVSECVSVCVGFCVCWDGFCNGLMLYWNRSENCEIRKTVSEKKNRNKDKEKKIKKVKTTCVLDNNCDLIDVPFVCFHYCRKCVSAHLTRKLFLWNWGGNVCVLMWTQEHVCGSVCLCVSACGIS